MGKAKVFVAVLPGEDLAGEMATEESELK